MTTWRVRYLTPFGCLDDFIQARTWLGAWWKAKRHGPQYAVHPQFRPHCHLAKVSRA